jgi:hypothetical protein
MEPAPLQARKTLQAPLTPESPELTHEPEQSPALPTLASPGSKIVDENRWAVYHPDPNHLWNRLFRGLFLRMGSDGQEYGWDSLDPLLWPETEHLLVSDSHQQAIRLLEEFLESGGEAMVTSPLERAMLQRDLWAVFDWLAAFPDVHPEGRQALLGRIALSMHRLALDEAEIRGLPDNLSEAILSGFYPEEYQDADPGKPFLPAGLFSPDGAWVCLGREGGPAAMAHTEGFPFFGRSAFLVFIRAPGEREHTLELVQALNSNRLTGLPPGTEVALVRRMALVDRGGRIIPAPIVESVQVRHFTNGIAQRFFEFVIDRKKLFAGENGGLRPTYEEIPLFFSHGDWFGFGSPEMAPVPELCEGCHVDGFQGILGAQSILSHSRARFPLSDGNRPVLFSTTLERELQTVIEWKERHRTWQELRDSWEQSTPEY